jgi:bifunctional non-homologous end joining protein LigD
MNFTPIIPFEPISAKQIPSGHNWIAQMKWDGVRMLIYYDGHKVSLINRRLHERTEQYPEFLEPTEYCTSSSFILDGEFIAFDENRPSFHEIMKRDSLRKQQNIEQAVARIPVTFMLFDVLFHEGNWMLDKTLQERQEIINTIIKPQSNVQIVQSFNNAAELLEVMRNHKMEGVVCKNLESTYSIAGNDNRWQKIKIFFDLKAFVAGVTLSGNIVNSLLLGLYDGKGGLNYIGHSGPGKLTNKEMLEITAQALSNLTPNMPFTNKPQRHKDAVWVTPQMVVKVQYMEWTPNNTMRHPSVQAIIKDVPLTACSVMQLQ